MRRGTSLVGLLLWSAGGALLGLGAGLLASETIGEAGPARLRGAIQARRPRRALWRTGHLARLVRHALRTDPALAALPLEVLPVSARTVELHGWVATRHERTHAARVARGIPGLESIINCILVHGEDDTVHFEDTTASA